MKAKDIKQKEALERAITSLKRWHIELAKEQDEETKMILKKHIENVKKDVVNLKKKLGDSFKNFWQKLEVQC